MKAALANRLWLFASRKAAKDFHHASHHVAETQARILQSYLNKNRETEYVNKYTSKKGNTNLQSPITNYQFPLSPATVNQHKQSLKDDMSEYMLNNLRLTNVGVAESDFRLRFGSGLRDVYPKEIEELVKNGLLEIKTSEVLETSEVYRLTKRGRLLGNQVFMLFV